MLDVIKTLIERGSPADLAAVKRYLETPYLRWEPRPDRPELWDEQTAFVRDKFDGLAVVLGGNASGKSEAGAYKTIHNLITTEPPKDLYKFFVVSETLEQAATLWSEKLDKLLPYGLVEKIEWISENRNQPKNVILKPMLGGKRWQLLFRSAEMGRKSFAGPSNVAGFWIDEPAPIEIISELWARCREVRFPGFKYWTNTPIGLMDDLEHRYENQADYPDWRFYRLNTECNSTLADISFLRNTPEELKETRRIGAFGKLQGAVFKNFDPAIHVIDPCQLPPHCTYYRVIDFGSQHDTACIWAARENQTGRYWIFHEWIGKGNAARPLLVKDKVAAIKAEVAFPDNGITLCDPSDAQQRTEFAHIGISCRNAKDKKETVTASIEWVQRMMAIQADGRPNLYIFNTCKTLISQIKGYQWMPETKSKMGTLLKASPEQPRKVKDDAVDCMRMLIYSTQNQISPWEGIKNPIRTPFRV